MFKIGKLEIPHRLLMAPMCDITHKAFRGILKAYGAGLVYTQMVSAKALVMRDPKTMHLLKYDESERPIGIQIFGNNADTLAEAAAIAQDLGPDLIDLNMGCPARRIVNDGGGSALLRHPTLVQEIFSKMRSVIKIPFTVKMRAGWDKDCLQAFQVAKLAYEGGLDAVCLHARTRAQGYSGAADWSMIKELKERISIPVIGNGDVKTTAEAKEMMDKTGCDAVMVGRTGFARPWFFKGTCDGVDYKPTAYEIQNLILRQYEAFFEYFGVNNGIRQMRKHLCAYTAGIPHSAPFRSLSLTMMDWSVLRQSIDEFFGTRECPA